MANQLLTRIESLLSSITTSNEEKDRIQTNILQFVDQIATDLNIPQTTTSLQTVTTLPTAHLNAFPTGDSLLTSFSHQQLSAQTSITQLSHNLKNPANLQSIQQLIKSASLTIPNNNNNNNNNNNQRISSQSPSHRLTQPLFPELCSLYDLQHDLSNLIRPKAGLPTAQQQQQENTFIPQKIFENGVLRTQKSSSSIAVASESPNIVWYLTSTSIIGIDIASLIESQFTTSFRATVVIPHSLQNDKINLSLYNNIIVNPNSTMAILWSSQPTSLAFTQSPTSPSFTAQQQTIPLPIVIDLPRLEIRPISLLDSLTSTNNSNNDENDFTDSIPIQNSKASFLITEQATILQKINKKQVQLAQLVSSNDQQQQSQPQFNNNSIFPQPTPVKTNNKTNTNSNIQFTIQKLRDQIEILSKLFFTTGTVQDIQFHALCPSTAILLTNTTLGMYTLYPSFISTHILPLTSLPIGLQSQHQQQQFE
jgi:hypothetical protein